MTFGLLIFKNRVWWKWTS